MHSKDNVVKTKICFWFEILANYTVSASRGLGGEGGRSSPPNFISLEECTSTRLLKNVT